MTDTLLLIDAETEVTASFEKAGAQRLSTSEQISENYRMMQSGARWVSEAENLTLLTGVLVLLTPSHPRPSLLLFDDPDRIDFSRWQLLSAFFHSVVPARRPGGHFLPIGEIAEVMASENPGDLVIGAEIDEKDRVVLLYRGTLEQLPVSFDFFHPAGDGTRPDFHNFSVADWGQTLRFGDYEATVDAVLYDRDEAFRARAKANRLKLDSTFGGSFRRLRLLRGLTQASFEGISDREIRRIEKNEIGPDSMQQETRRIIERCLRVSFEDITTF